MRYEFETGGTVRIKNQTGKKGSIVNKKTR